MSHYTHLEVQIKDQDALVEALCDVQGWTKEQIEVHNEPTALYGYHGDKRKDLAHVVIRRKYIGGSSNDIGFFRKADGTFEAIISDFDRSSMGYNEKWIGKLMQHYGASVTTKKLTKAGYRNVKRVYNPATRKMVVTANK